MSWADKVFWRKSKKDINANKEKLVKLRRQLLNLSGISDSTFDKLLSGVLEDIIGHVDLDNFHHMLSDIIADEYFYKESRKASFYLAVCLVGSEAAAKCKIKKDDVNGVKHHVEILTISSFHTILSKTPEGYNWIGQYTGLMKEVWLYLKAKRGRFVPYMEILHVESGSIMEVEIDREVSHGNDFNEIDDDFSAETDDEIGSLLSGGDITVKTDEDVLNQIHEDREDVGTEPTIEPEPSLEPEVTIDEEEQEDDETEGEIPDVLDVSSLLK